MIATATVRIAQAFDHVGDWLSRLPATPFTDFLSGALLLLRRTLLPNVPTIPKVSVDNVSGPEGDSSSVNAVFTVTLDKAYATPVTVGYATTRAGTSWEIPSATPGVDYTPVSGLLTFAPGQTSQQVSVTVLSDTEDEPTETFGLNIYATLPAANAATITGVVLAQGVGSILALQSGRSTINFNVHNFTSSTIQYAGTEQCSMGNDPCLENPPAVGTKIKPGEALRFEQYAYGWSNNKAQLKFENADDPEAEPWILTAVLDAALRLNAGSWACSGGCVKFTTKFEGQDIDESYMALRDVALVPWSLPLTRATQPPTGLLGNLRGPLTQGFDVYNFTNAPIKYTGHSDCNRPDGCFDREPTAGTTIEPGQSLHFEQIFYAFRTNSARLNFETIDTPKKTAWFVYPYVNAGNQLSPYDFACADKCIKFGNRFGSRLIETTVGVRNIALTPWTVRQP